MDDVTRTTSRGTEPRARARILEGHPEVSFREMARLHPLTADGAPVGGDAGVGDRPLAHGKASAAGLMLRADLLAAAGIAIPRPAHDALGTAALRPSPTAPATIDPQRRAAVPWAVARDRAVRPQPWKYAPDWPCGRVPGPLRFWS